MGDGRASPQLLAPMMLAAHAVNPRFSHKDYAGGLVSEPLQRFGMESKEPEVFFKAFLKGRVQDVTERARVLAQFNT